MEIAATTVGSVRDLAKPAQKIYAGFNSTGATKGAGKLYDAAAKELTVGLLAAREHFIDVGMDTPFWGKRPVELLSKKQKGYAFLEQLYKRVGLPFDRKTAAKTTLSDTIKLFAERLRSMSIKELQNMTKITAEKTDSLYGGFIKKALEKVKVSGFEDVVKKFDVGGLCRLAKKIKV